MLPATGRQVRTALRGQERRWAWTWPHAGRDYGRLLAGQFAPRALGSNQPPVRFRIPEEDLRAMPVRGIRGATTVSSNSKDEIIEAAKELLSAMIDANGIDPDDVASAFFTTTPDLNAEFPAVAPRQMGWKFVP